MAALVWALVLTAEQEVYLDPALRGIEIYPPRGVYPQAAMLSALEVDLIHKEAEAVPHHVAEQFGRRYKNWRATWANGAAKMGGDEYDKLTEMGEAILPLLIEKLLSEEELPAIVLYDHMIPLELFVQSAPDDPPAPPVAARVRALKSIRRWLTQARKATYDRKD